MKKYSEFLYDDIGNPHVRKNLYLKEISEGHAMSDLQKKNHPYYQAFDAFRSKEKEFLNDLKELRRKEAELLATVDSVKLRRLRLEYFTAQKKAAFYQPYQELCYDALFEYKKALIEVEQYPMIIEHYRKNHEELFNALKDKKHIDLEEEQKVKEEIVEFKKIKKAQLEKGIEAIRAKRKERQISAKALDDGIGQLKTQYKEAVLVKSYDLPSKSNRELIGNKRYEITKRHHKNIVVLKSNISDLRRKTPVEVENQVPLNAFLSFFLPGLGQLLNRQYAKAILFALASVFIYMIALPYALGFGNYQGQGIAGLISLAEDGKKLDKSIIFMIEGIVALFLVLFALCAYYLSFVDVYKVQKAKIRGVRPKNWFETKTSIFEDGFPYMVSAPALVVTVFVVLVPITTAILLSFTNMGPKSQSKFVWVGLENYKLIALGQGIAGSAFWEILYWTLIWTLCSTTLAVAIGFILALLVNNERIKGKVFFRSVYLLPWAVPAFITIMFFSIMFANNGILTEIISNIIGSPIEIKNNPTYTRIALIALQGWLGSSYVFLLSTGVLQAIPEDLYEAAQIDGATTWQKLKRITVPIVLFQTAPLLVGQYTFNFNNFSIIYLFNGGGPYNPTKYGNLAGSSDLLISYIYKLTTENDYQAIGAAITIVISLGLMLFAFIGFKNSKAFKEEKL